MSKYLTDLLDVGRELVDTTDGWYPPNWKSSSSSSARGKKTKYIKIIQYNFSLKLSLYKFTIITMKKKQIQVYTILADISK